MKEWNMKQKVEGEEGSGEGSNCKKEAGRRREMKEASTKKDKQEWKWKLMSLICYANLTNISLVEAHVSLGKLMSLICYANITLSLSIVEAHVSDLLR